MRSLKLSIFLNYAVLVAAGMLLIAFVILVFWQKHVTSLMVNQAKMHISLVEDDIFFTCDQLMEGGYSRLEQYRDQHVGEGFDLSFFQNGKLILGSSTNEWMITWLEEQGAEHYSDGNILEKSTKKINGRNNIVVAKRLENKCGNSWITIVVQLDQAFAQIKVRYALIYVYILVNVIILTTIGFFRMRKVAVKPLDDLVSLSESFGNFEDELINRPQTSNEFRHVANALKDMFHTIEKDRETLREAVRSLEIANKQILENQAKLIETEKFAAVGRLSAGLAHEIGNPLGIIQGYIELLQRSDISLEDRVQYAERAVKELDRMNRLIRQLLDYARKDEDSDSQVLVAPVINEVVEIVKHQQGAEGIEFVVECDDSNVSVSCSEANLHQVLLNCLLNSIDALSDLPRPNGEISVSCELNTAEHSSVAEIVIHDNGPGIKPDVLTSVFDPFFTTKEVGRGTGLGLSVSRSIIENCGGTMTLTSENDSGAKVTIALPAAEQ